MALFTTRGLCEPHSSIIALTRVDFRSFSSHLMKPKPGDLIIFDWNYWERKPISAHLSEKKASLNVSDFNVKAERTLLKISDFNRHP
jgi:hypothetical protein